jgi:hypothetical protein
MRLIGGRAITTAHDDAAKGEALSTMIEPAEGEFSGKGSSVKHSGDVAAECWSCCGRGNHPGREDESSSAWAGLV